MRDDGRAIELLRRPASVVLRQRRQGDGEREAGLSDRVADAGARRAARSARRDAEFLAALERRLRATRRARRSADADDRRGRRARARPRRGGSARASSTGCRTSSRSRRRTHGTRLAMEGLALTGAWVDRERGLVSSIVLEMGGSSDLCDALAPGEPVVLMGPTGTPTEIERDETVLLVGGGLGNAVLFSIGARVSRCRLEGAVLRRLPADGRPLQGRGDRGGGRRGRLVLRRGTRLHAHAPAGPRVRRQHRRGDARLRERRAGRAADRASTNATGSSRSARTR